MNQNSTQRHGPMWDWKNTNPLRKWRLDNFKTQGMAALTMAVSLQTIMLWEMGGVMPDNNNFDRLKRLLSNERLEDDWAEWYGDRPNGE